MNAFPHKLEVIENPETGKEVLAFLDEPSGTLIYDPRASTCGRFSTEPAVYGLTEIDAKWLEASNKLGGLQELADSVNRHGGRYEN